MSSTTTEHGFATGEDRHLKQRLGRDEVRLMVSPGHRVTCTRWFAHHDPRDAQAMLNSEIFGNCVLAPFTRKYVQAASHEQIG